MGGAAALRLDDVGAASKRFEVYGVTRLPLGPFRLPFPGNFLFLKYVPPIKRWGPYAELSAAAWEWIVAALEAAHARMTVGITAGWVEDDASVTPFPRKFPAAAAVIRAAAARGVLEVANHGYTHCVLDNGMFRPRLFHGNRPFHREFYDWLPEAVHREHVTRAQGILQDYLGEAVVTRKRLPRGERQLATRRAIRKDLRPRTGDAWRDRRREAGPHRQCRGSDKRGIRVSRFPV